MRQITNPHRASKPIMGMVSALTASLRSEDPRTYVGCAIEDVNGRIIATGCNGYPPGYRVLPRYPGTDVALFDPNGNWFPLSTTMDDCIHAERNAFNIAGRRSYIVYCTHSPCFGCAQRARDEGVQYFYYLNDHPQAGKFREHFDKYGIIYRQFTPEEKEKVRIALEWLLSQARRLSI